MTVAATAQRWSWHSGPTAQLFRYLRRRSNNHRTLPIPVRRPCDRSSYGKCHESGAVECPFRKSATTFLGKHMCTPEAPVEDQPYTRGTLFCLLNSLVAQQLEHLEKRMSPRFCATFVSPSLSQKIGHFLARPALDADRAILRKCCSLHPSTEEQEHVSTPVLFELMATANSSDQKANSLLQRLRAARMRQAMSRTERTHQHSNGTAHTPSRPAGKNRSPCTA